MGILDRPVNWLIRGMTDRMVDYVTENLVDRSVGRMLQEPYTENVFSTYTTLKKIGLIGLVEAGMRAETGHPIERPLGSPIPFSQWEKLLFNPVHLFRMPTQDGVRVDTGVVLGPKAQRPLRLDIPILITGMSYGGALSKRVKIALAKGSAMMGTATNSGEAPLLPEERAAAKSFIGQFNRGGWLNSHEDLQQLDAIEVMIGQGAQGSAPMRTPSQHIGREMREIFHLKPGEDHVIHSRLPGVDSPEQFMALVKRLRERYGVPVGLKIAAGHYLEREMDIGFEAGIDYFVVDGAEGGTHGGPTILQDALGLPTLMALARAAKHREKAGLTRDVSLIAAGGLTTPAHFAKALALGADAVYIGTIALVALMQTQALEAIPSETPAQTVLYQGKFREDLDVDLAAQHLAKFLRSCVKEMELLCASLGKTALSQLDRSDLCATDIDVARFCRVDYAGFSPEEQPVAFSAFADAGLPAGNGVYPRVT